MSEDEVISEPVRFALLDLAVQNSDFSGAELAGTREWLLKEIKTTGRSKCSADATTEDPPESLPSTTPHWRREGQQRQRTESEVRAFQKRVAKRRAKKRSKK